LQKIQKQQLRRKFGELEVDNASDGAEATTPDDTSPDVTIPETNILISKYPLVEKWEDVEAAEAEEVTRKHASRLRWFDPEKLPVLVHVAAPQSGRFTREVQSDIEQMNNIEAVKDLVKSSLVFELIRTNIDPSRARFAGLMVYGPTTEFATKSIHSFTRGLFLQEAAFKKWWLSVHMRQRVPGDMVKIAVVLWDVDEAAAKRIELPDFWTEGNARVLANHLEKLEMPIWDLEIEKGCRSYVKMQEQVLEARIQATNAMGGDWKIERKALQVELRKAVKSKEKLANYSDALANAIDEANMEEAARLVAEWKKAIKGKGKAKEADDDDDDGDDDGDEEGAQEDEDEAMGDVDNDDPNDRDYAD